jgi:hypothetical protein
MRSEHSSFVLIKKRLMMTLDYMSNKAMWVPSLLAEMNFVLDFNNKNLMWQCIRKLVRGKVATALITSLDIL